MYFDPQSLSPDPTYGRKTTPLAGNAAGMKLFPHRLVRISPENQRTRRWAQHLNIFEESPALPISPDGRGWFEIVLDFGTELDAELEIVCTSHKPITLVVFFGESEYEAEGLTQHSRVPDVPAAIEHYSLEGRGRHAVRAAARGFRFVKIVIPEFPAGGSLESVAAHARFAGRTRLGDFRCSDALFQRIWQSAAYTARLCMRADAYWDGIKRDRLGWYGDARITQIATDAVFFDPTPALRMLLNLPVNSWANDIPTYSFDAIAMLKQTILTYGASAPELVEIFRRVKAMLAWAQRTHVGADGLLHRNDRVPYFFGIGFLDWSVMPIGGRFEELCWLQCRYLEALNLTAEVAGLLGRHDDARHFSGRAEKLRPIVLKRFWNPRTGFVHTRNRTITSWQKLLSDKHYRDTYERKIRLGSSGPSRHSNALAVWAGLCSEERFRRKVISVLNDGHVPPVITPYFAYYEQCARAQCGDREGALLNMRNYLGRQIVENDSPTIWESFEPEVKGFNRWGLGGWAKSLCHGWSSGVVPMTMSYLLGIVPNAPGFAKIILRPPSSLPWTFEAVVPTPHGKIKIARERRNGPVRYQLPRGVAPAAAIPEGAIVDQRSRR
jgi:alpha-L-rhamnosidase